MPQKDRTGPPKSSTGKKDGSGQGKGNYSKSKSGTGAKTGGKKGKC